MAMSLSLANHRASLPVAWRLYLPKEWAADHERRRKAGVLDEIDFKTKPEIALEQIEAALKAGLSRGVVLMDAGYGCNTNRRTAISALALTYVAGILPHTTVWAPGTGPLPPKKWSGRGQRPTRLRRDDKHKPIAVEELALGLPKRSWRRIEWREGTAEPSRFARVRVRVAHRDYACSESWPEEWLLIEWPEGEEKPAKYWLSTLPGNITFRNWGTSPNCVGVSSAIIRTSSKRSGSNISKDEAGAASITMPRCASRPTDFWSRRGR